MTMSIATVPVTGPHGKMAYVLALSESAAKQLTELLSILVPAIDAVDFSDRTAEKFEQMSDEHYDNLHRAAVALAEQLGNITTAATGNLLPPDITELSDFMWNRSSRTTSQYTAQVEEYNENQAAWDVVVPAHTLDDFEGSAQQAADWVAETRTEAAGVNRRVRVWNGPDADTTTEPDAQHADTVESLMDELVAARRKAASLTAVRDAHVRQLMETNVPRVQLAEAAGVTEARLYQIRDGRR